MSRLNVSGHVECSSTVVVMLAKSAVVPASTKRSSGSPRRRSTDHWPLQHLVQWMMASNPSTSALESAAGYCLVVITSARIWTTKGLAVLAQRRSSRKLLATVAALFYNLHYLVVRSLLHVDTTVNDQKPVVIHKCLIIATRTTSNVHDVLSWSKRHVFVARRL